METQELGVISDTHGLVRPSALAALAGVCLIIHAGDVGQPAVLEALREIAPVVAVRGNVDRGEWANELPEKTTVAAAGKLIHVLHDLHQLDVDPRAAGYAVVISGHSHRARVAWEDGILYLNPGSAGPRRFGLGTGLARLRIDANGIEPQLLEIGA